MKNINKKISLVNEEKINPEQEEQFMKIVQSMDFSDRTNKLIST